MFKRKKRKTYSLYCGFLFHSCSSVGLLTFHAEGAGDTVESRVYLETAIALKGTTGFVICHECGRAATRERLKDEWVKEVSLKVE